MTDTLTLTEDTVIAIQQGLEQEKQRLRDARKSERENRSRQEREQVKQSIETASAPQALVKAKELYDKKMPQEANYAAARWLEQEYTIITDMKTGQLYVYSRDKGIYEEQGEEILRHTIEKAFSTHATRNTIAEILNHVKNKSYVREEEFAKRTPLHLIPLKNGILDIRTRELLPHNPEYYFRFQFPVSYDPAARCPTIEQFIADVVPPSDQGVLLDIPALCLYRARIVQKYFILVGNANNGKSVYITLLRSFVGDGNHTGLTPQALTTDKFATASLYNLTLCAGADIGSEAIKDDARLKEITGGDRISAQHKFGRYFEFTPYAQLVFSANTPPRFDNGSKATFKRICTLHFPFTYGTPQEVAANPNVRLKDDTIGQRMTTEGELSGLLNLAIDHLIAIQKSGDLSKPETIAEAEAEYVRVSNSPLAFINECCEEELYEPGDKAIDKPATGFVITADLYNEYKTWCKRKKLHLVTRTRFSQALIHANEWNLDLEHKDKGKNGELERSIRGIGLKSPTLNPANPLLLNLKSYEKNINNNIGKNKIGKSGFSGFGDEAQEEMVLGLDLPPASADFISRDGVLSFIKAFGAAGVREELLIAAYPCSELGDWLADLREHGAIIELPAGTYRVAGGYDE